MSALPISMEKTSRRTNSQVASSPLSAQFALVVGKLPEDLREILHVHGFSVGEAVEPLHGERLVFHRMDRFRQSFDACDINEFVFRDGDADAPGQFQHGKFVFEDDLEAGGRQFDDPKSNALPRPKVS
jgi:hypothetical protein